VIVPRFPNSEPVTLLPPDIRLNVFAIVLLLGAAGVGMADGGCNSGIVVVHRRHRAGGDPRAFPRVANQWRRAIVLRLGRYIGSRRSWAVLDYPFVEGVSAWTTSAQLRRRSTPSKPSRPTRYR